MLQILLNQSDFLSFSIFTVNLNSTNSMLKYIRIHEIGNHPMLLIEINVYSNIPSNKLIFIYVDILWNLINKLKNFHRNIYIYIYYTTVLTLISCNDSFHGLVNQKVWFVSRANEIKKRDKGESINLYY